MNCPNCQHENSAAARFCESCGAALTRSCTGCGAQLAAGARFCAQCGRPAEGAAAAPATLAAAAVTQSPTTGAGERRLLTAMFCDLVGFTELSQRVDAEELRELVSTYQGACADAVKRYDGHIAQYLGDGVLVYFGYPQAHEDDAQRAIRAALAIQGSLAALKAGRRAAGVSEIAARIGIHTGPVVVSTLGSDEHRETLALGETVNIAARLDALAEPGGIVVSDATLRLAGTAFVTRDLGLQAAKGLSQPVHVHAVERASMFSLLPDAARAATPLVGRERELGQLLDLWERAGEGHGQVALISAEAGLGKTRLLRALRDQLRGQSSVELQCSPYSSGSAFQPLVDSLQRSLELGEGDSAAQKLEKLERGLAQGQDAELGDVVPYLAPLLGLPASPRHPLPQISADLQRERTLRALLAPIFAAETRGPVLVVCEDLHWSDPSTLELLGLLIDQAPMLRLLLVLTFRPSFNPPWPTARSYLSPIALARLGGRNTRDLVANAVGAAKLPERVLDEIAARADGVPLFAEELARSVIESGLLVESRGRLELRGRLADLAIPTTLQGSLMARLDRLSTAKAVAQLAATLGREFPYALLEAVADLDVPSLRSGLAQLADAEILFQRGEPPNATYTFKHALLQDTAYESQLKSRRREIHARIVSVIEERFPARVSAEPELMARHCAEGGLAPRAIEYYRQAGQQAIARYARAEAVDYLSTALELLGSSPEQPERDALEISLRLVLSGPLGALGYRRPETIENVERVALLCEHLPLGPARIPALLGLATLNQMRGNLRRSRHWAEALLAIVEPLGIAPLCVAGHAMIGSASLTAGTLPEALEHLGQALELLRKAPLPPPSGAFDIDVLTLVSNVRGIALALAGQPELARETCQAALRRAREIDHAQTLILARSASSVAYYFLDDWDAAYELSNACIEPVERLGFSDLSPNPLAYRGWARVQRGDAGGLADIERGIAVAVASETDSGLVQLHLLAATAQLKLANYAGIDQSLASAAAVIELTGERSAYAPQVLLFRAARILYSGSEDLATAERLVQESFAGWDHYQSPCMELRSALLFAEIALRTGDHAPATARLAKGVAGYGAGAETHGLREARRLLQALGA